MVISSIFDPLWILSPTVTNLKLLFQELCFMKIDRHVSLAIEFVSKWKSFIRKFSNRYYLFESTLFTTFWFK